MTTSSQARSLRPVTPVGLIAQRLERLRDRAGELPDDLAAELRAVHSLAAGYEPYINDSTSPASAELVALAEATTARDWENRMDGVIDLEAEMLSGHVEGAALRFLVAMSRARTVLEIGMFTGYATLAMAEALSDDGRVIACEIDPDTAAFAQAHLSASTVADRIEIRVGAALDTLASLAAERRQFDFVFIDADKGGYLDYVTAILDNALLSTGGTIAVDNTLLQGEPWLPREPSRNGAAITLFNATVAGDPRVEQVVLAVRDGLTLIRLVP